MNLKKFIIPGCVALTLGMTSCVGDLDLQPNDPNLVNTSDPEFKANTLAMCYSGLACSGISGPGSSYVSGLDAGTSAYLRVIFTLQEFPTDELIWIWSDAGIPDITFSSWSSNNGILTGAYYRFLGHIALCNQYLQNTKDDTDAESMEMRAQARTLRAFSYYNMIDLFGMSSFITEEAEVGSAPVQISRKDLFNWLEDELKDIVDNERLNKNPIYGRVGHDAAEALLAKLYLNAEVYTGEGRWADCAQRCENIINRHKGTGFQNSGLAEHYLYLFSAANNAYMPGGSKPAENEILFGIAFDETYTQSYGGPTFIISGTVSNTHYMPRQIYGTSSEWSCIRGCYEMAERFYGYDNDVRDDLWLKGEFPAGKLYQTTADGNSLKLGDDGQPMVALNDDGTEVAWDAEDYSDRFKDFSGDWKTTGGNAIVKFTGRTPNTAQDGGWNISVKQHSKSLPFNGKDYQVANEEYEIGFSTPTFSSVDQPVIRLADIYLMYAECYVHDRSAAQASKALEYVNYVRARAKAPAFIASDLTRKGIMDERSRELYLEGWRRSDLVRNGMFAGPQQTVWQYKGSGTANEGTRIDSKYNLYPIPYDVRATQPEFKQNPGY